MPKPGPAPKPTRLKVAAGNPGKRPLNPAEPQPAVGAPPCPGWLPGRAADEWRRIVPELLALGLLSRIDLAALASYCVAVGELEDATRTLEAEGRVVRQPMVDKAGAVVGERLKSHPAVSMQRDAARLIKGFVSEFGLSPASRTRVSAAPTEKAKPDGRESRFFPTVG